MSIEVGDDVVPLLSLEPGSLIPLSGGRAFRVPAAFAAAYRPGDELIVLPDRARVLLVPRARHEHALRAVDAAVAAFGALARVGDATISAFFAAFADRLRDDAAFAAIDAANAADVARADAAGRPVGRLVLTPRMRADMIAGLEAWRASPSGRSRRVDHVRHEGWEVELRTAPLGVVGFVFEGRPNVFADAAGVLRTGNAVVFRIGRDALGTARAMVAHAVAPALAASGLPPGAITLLDDPSHEAAWALFADPRLSLAVARGSGEAVALLGAIARARGTPVSLHGTGGAWLFVDRAADLARVRSAVVRSLDRKVCNTLNVCLVHADRIEDVLPALRDALTALACDKGAPITVHAVISGADRAHADAIRDVFAADTTANHDAPVRVHDLPSDRLGHEWEWDQAPELSLAVVAGLDEAVDLFNRWSPRFVASILSDDPEAQRRFRDAVDAPFVGDGMTRWVDGHYALGRPELGLSNWQNGRMLGRGGVLSGDNIHTVRTFATQHDPTLAR